MAQAEARPSRPSSNRAEARGPTRVANRIVRVLAEEGIDRTFGIPGGTISPIVDALLDSGIEHVTCQHESMAVYMAAGYARATGKPAVVVVTSGPGVLNTMTGLAAAYQDEIPVLVLAGDVATPNEGRGSLQDGSDQGLDVVRMAESITKVAASLDRPARAEAVIRDALSTMCAVPQGPALLRLPFDCTTRADAGTEMLAQSIHAASVPNDAICRNVAELFASAQRPAIFVGGAVRRVGAERALRALAEVTRCPVMTDLEAKGIFPEQTPLSLGIFGVGGKGRAARYLEGGVDLLVTVGARLDDTTTANYSPLLQPAGTLVQIDHDPRRLGRSYQPDIVLHGQLTTALERIRETLPRIGALTLLARDRGLSEAPDLSVELDPIGGAPHDPRSVIVALQRAFDDSTIFTSDIGNHLLFAGMHLICDRPDQFHVSLGLGGMTSGIGMAMGLQQAYGDRRRVVGICGDGGLMMCGNELATCARYEIPVTLAVFNDGQLGMVQHGSERVYGRSHDFRVPTTDLVAYARSLGADAIRVTGPQDLERAAAWRRRPLLLDIPINPRLRAQNPRNETLNFPEAS